jgi:hypothetical protein
MRKAAFGASFHAPTERRVPRFHFQVRTDTHVLLAEAADLAGTTEARVEAARRVGELLKEHAAAIWADEEWHMDVTDEVGLILFAIHIAAMKSPATTLEDRAS